MAIEKKKAQFGDNQLDDIIEYYFWFFKGMYEFKRKDFVAAIIYYKIAEKKVAAVDDEVEKAEFYYKLAEIYYHINQHYLSMNYASLALGTFKAHETLLEKKIFCEFIIAGNLVETSQYKEALSNLLNALEDAHYFKKMKRLDEARIYYKKSIQARKKIQKGDVLHKDKISIYLLFYLLQSC